MKEPRELEEGEIEYMVIWRAKWGGKEYSDSMTIDPNEADLVLRADTVRSLNENVAFAKSVLKAAGVI